MPKRSSDRPSSGTPRESLSRNLGYEEDRHVSKCSSDPQQRYVKGEPGKVQGRDRVGIVEGSCGYRARGVIIRGKFVLQDEGSSRG